MDIKMPNKIILDDLIKEYQISDINSLINYLSEIWYDLSFRSKNQQKGMEKLYFSKYYELPGIILDRLFAVFDQNQDGFLNREEFIIGMKILFYQNEPFDSLAKLIFNFYDFDKNNLINKEDVRIVLSYIPINNYYNNKNEILDINFDSNFKDIEESQNQIFETLNIAFKDKKEMNIEQFCDLIKNNNSDIFIYILSFLLERRPFTNETIQMYMFNQNISPELILSKIPKTNNIKIATPTLTNKFISPKFKRLTFQQKIKTEKTNPKNVLISYSKNVQNSSSKKNPEIKKEQSYKVIPINNNGNIIKEIKIKENNINENNNHPLRRERIKLDELSNKNSLLQKKFPIKYEEIKSEDYNNSSEEEEENDFDFEDEEQKPLILHEGYMYKMYEEKKLRKVYFCLVGKDIYYFKKKKDKKHKGIHNLSGVYVKKDEDIIINGKTFYSITILYPQKNRTYYFDDESSRKIWFEKLKNVIDQKSILDNYIVKSKIGKGKFGLIKFGINKQTKQPVAIKIMSKKNMEKSDLELAKTEIDILKISQHPNIIKIYDDLETEDYIYIIMEYCSGGDLYSFIEKTNYKLPEKKACEIIHKLSMVIYYIHSFGIVHRDLKPENILMTDNTKNSDIRLLDFGLSKILGPDEKCNEPYGTLSFVAPEVLLKKPYDKMVDLWSLGIITFLLLCGYLPFDDKNSEVEIVRKTVEEPVIFKPKIWNKLSKEAKNFVEKLLVKNPEKRMNIDEVLEHAWIKKFSKVPDNTIISRSLGEKIKDDS